MYLTLVVLPFVGSLLVAVRGRSLGFSGAGIVTTGCIAISALLAWVAVFEVILARSPVALVAFDWFSIGPDQLKLDWVFLFDDLSVVMAAVVLSVSSLVHCYSLDYMAGDPHGQRFMALLSLFTAFMILLVTGDSLAIMFVGKISQPNIVPPYAEKR